MSFTFNTSFFVFIFLFATAMVGILFKLNNLKRYRSEFDTKLPLLENYFFARLPRPPETTEFNFPEDSRTGKLEREANKAFNDLNTVSNKLMYTLGAQDMNDLYSRIKGQNFMLTIQLVTLNAGLILLAFANGNLFQAIPAPTLPVAMCVSGAFTLYVCVKKMRLMFKTEHIIETVRSRDFL